MKKVLFIIPTLKVGGTTSSLSAIYTSLGRSNVDIDVFSLTHQGDGTIFYSFKSKLLKEDIFLSAYYGHFSRAKGLRKLFFLVVEFLKRFSVLVGFNLGNLINKISAAKIERKYKYDTIVAFEEGVSTKFGSLFNCNNKISWVHCDYNRYLPMNKTEESIYARFNKIVCVSEYTKSVFCERYPKLAKNTIAIHNILDDERIIELSSDPIRDSRYINDKFTIISIGRIDPVKQFHLIPQITRELLDRGLSIRWYILGLNIYKYELKRILENTNKYNVLNEVMWLGNKSNPYPYFIKSDLLVTLSASEACPMVFNEAKILSLPIVTTNFGSAYEFIENGVNGSIAPINKISNEIEKMITDKRYYTNIKNNIDNFKINNQVLIEKILILIDASVQ